MDLLGDYSSSEESAHSDTEDVKPTEATVTPAQPALSAEPEPRRMVGVAMPPPSSDSSRESSVEPTVTIPEDLPYAQDRALLLSLSSPDPQAQPFDIPPQQGTNPEAARLLAQFTRLKTGSDNQAPVHFNERLAQNPELGRPGWLAQQTAFMNVKDTHRAKYLTEELPTKEEILAKFHHKKSTRTKIEFTSS